MKHRGETLRKRVDLRELVLVETTCVTSHPALPFSSVVERAKDTVRPEDDATFVAAVNIRRTRSHRISPLGLPSAPPPPGSEALPVLVEQALEEAPPLPDFDNPDPEEKPPETPQGRLDRWKRKLLDLTNRNPLLNHRVPKTNLPIICPEPGRFAQAGKGAVRQFHGNSRSWTTRPSPSTMRTR